MPQVPERKARKLLVGERGFEPPTPWSRTRFKHLLKLVEFCGFQVIAVEPVASRSWEAIELWCYDSLKIATAFLPLYLRDN
jgi:hypothetical protein